MLIENLYNANVIQKYYNCNAGVIQITHRVRGQNMDYLDNKNTRNIIS